MVKIYSLRTLAAVAIMAAATCTAVAQSVNINFGPQRSFDASEVNNISLETPGKVIVNRASAGSVEFSSSAVSSIGFSDAPADKARKYMDNEPAQVLFNCIEVNNTNPLQTQNFRLKTSDKYFFDAVILFSSNINFSKKENVVYIHNNDNVQAILNHYDHYIKPLKDKGIKVILSILGNHDGSGLANMDDTRCRLFAKAIADTLDKYNLDGVFFDDEYSDYYSNDLNAMGFKGFQNYPSTACASRLAYETKKAIGDRWVIPYKYGAFNALAPVDGVNPAEFVDYVLLDYNQWPMWTSAQSAYPGIEKSQWGAGSINLSGYTNWTNHRQNARTAGYGALMLYNLDQTAASFSYSYQDTMEKVANYYFNDELVVDNTRYTKDWTPVKGLETPNR